MAFFTFSSFFLSTSEISMGRKGTDRNVVLPHPTTSLSPVFHLIRGETATSCPSLVKILAPYLSPSPPSPLSLSLLRVDVISGPPPRKRSVGGRDPAGRTSSFLLPNQHFGSLEPQRTTDASAIKSGEQRGDARFPPQLAAGRGDPLEELKKTRASHFFFLFVLFSRFLFRLASFSFSTLGPKLAHCSQSLLPSSLGEDQGGVGRTGEG